MGISLAPDILTQDEVNIIIMPALNAARGLGRELATLPAENGWDQSTFFDHDAADFILAFALNEAKAWAKANQRFYNNEKLEDAITLALTLAYSEGFLA